MTWRGLSLPLWKGDIMWGVSSFWEREIEGYPFSSGEGVRKQERQKEEAGKQVVREVTLGFSASEDIERTMFCRLRGMTRRDNWCPILNLMLLKEMAMYCDSEPTFCSCIRVDIFDVFLGKENAWVSVPDPPWFVVCCDWDEGRTSWCPEWDVEGSCAEMQQDNQKATWWGTMWHYWRGWGWGKPETQAEWRLSTNQRVVSSAAEFQ